MRLSFTSYLRFIVQSKRKKKKNFCQLNNRFNSLPDTFHTLPYCIPEKWFPLWNTGYSLQNIWCFSFLPFLVVSTFFHKHERVSLFLQYIHWFQFLKLVLFLWKNFDQIRYFGTKVKKGLARCFLFPKTFLLFEFFNANLYFSERSSSSVGYRLQLSWNLQF